MSWWFYVYFVTQNPKAKLRDLKEQHQHKSVGFVRDFYEWTNRKYLHFLNFSAATTGESNNRNNIERQSDKETQFVAADKTEGEVQSEKKETAKENGKPDLQLNY